MLHLGGSREVRSRWPHSENRTYREVAPMASPAWRLVKCLRRTRRMILPRNLGWIHQYPIMRPALMAVSQQRSETPPITASLNSSREESSRILCSFQAGKQ
jgi:hypothetical protein